MNTLTKGGIIAALAISVVGVIASKRQPPCSTTCDPMLARNAPIQAVAPPQSALPRMLEFGSTTCIPCKAMQPIIADLEQHYADKLSVKFIDVTKDPDTVMKFNINVIPTQLFLDVSGKELFRHEGFFAKEEILAKWRELGYLL